MEASLAHLIRSGADYTGALVSLLQHDNVSEDDLEVAVTWLKVG